MGEKAALAWLFSAVILLIACGGSAPSPTSDEKTLPPVTPAAKPPSHAPVPVAASPASTPAPARRLNFNGATITADALTRLQSLETSTGTRVPDGDYWYDNATGAWGLWGGPAAGLIPAGLSLGGAMPPNSSGGGTGVFINGRELNPVDVQRLQQITPVVAGRYWMDAQGNGGLEGQPASFNLVQLAQQANRGNSGGAWSHATSTPSGNNYVGGDGQGFTYFQGADGSAVYIDH